MENFPQTFEPTKSGSILEQFMELRHYVDDRLTEIEQEIVAGDDTKVYFDNVKQEDVYFTSDPQTQITANKNDITSLSTRVGTNTLNIGDLQTRYNGLENSVVKFTTQSLTSEQQAQARSNIGAGTSSINVVDDLNSTSATDALSGNQGRVLDGKISTNSSSITGLENSVVKFTAQSLTAEQQAQARSNIGAGSSTINVVDNLNSTSAFDALSANQGRVLDGKFSGKQDTINSGNPLSADLVDDTSTTNKFVSSSDITNWNGKTTLAEVYPVGAIYLSTESTSPASLFGGSWSQIKDTFLLTAGDTYTAGSTGGEATHILTIDEIPSHSHNFLCATDLAGDSNGARMAYNNYQWRGQMTSTGGDQPHNNMPPYLVVYAWQRIS